eukprot:CAMPEP_0119324566 /NCGR_PEP_ID=MMETSP1333-20130426/63611_1 /TAXON_ID=418940 /ORGANISM="Scyphosphaera apsteinii, Strain RCC1455" /LENGTH=42 /DNA_ID= /DNA_START= /DNA_END= /DNA_ORIENTATION=
MGLAEAQPLRGPPPSSPPPKIFHKFVKLFGGKQRSLHLTLTG